MRLIKKRKIKTCFEFTTMVVRLFLTERSHHFFCISEKMWLKEMRSDLAGN